MINELKDKNILVIVESPNKVQHIQEYLKKAGYKAKVMASVGHIMELANGGPYVNSGIDPAKNFEMNLQVSADKTLVVNRIKEQVKAADLVYLMSDPDREGFVIAWSLIKFLDLPVEKCRRAITHEITPKAVVYAVEHPIKMDNNLVDAGLARLCLDKMVGFRLSPIARACIGAKSVGRCQSAGLKLICDREKEIQNFVAEYFFDIYFNFNKKKSKFKAKYIGTKDSLVDHIKLKAVCDDVLSACNGKFIISNIERKEKTDSPKPPFCTATFQQEAASKLGIKVKQAMDCAQKLFENSYITYMRTDDQVIADEFIPTLKSYITDAFGKDAWTTPRRGKVADGAQQGHECLRVTKPEYLPDLFEKANGSGLLSKVYKLIWQRTIAACLPNAKISETTYTIENNDHLFTLVSNELLSAGYKSVYNYVDDTADVTNTTVKESFKLHEELTPSVTKTTDKNGLEVIEKSTKPKPRFTEATLIKELQKREIGRPSTYATIVETVLSQTRGYAVLDGKSIVPTNAGMKLAEFLDTSFSNIINTDYTRAMESGLDKIAAGKTTKQQFLTEFYNTLESTIKQSKTASLACDTPTCPICGAPMVARRSKYGKLFYGCSTFPKCRGIINIK